MKILFLDIETSPIVAHVWSLWDNNVALNQIVEDWSVLSWAAKWHDEKEVLYADNRKAKKVRNDKKLLKKMWRLLDDADIVITQNGKKFDIKKLNARFIINGFPPPSSFRQIDSLEIAKKVFGFTSNKLEYTSENVCTKYKKLKHKDFPGQELWTECLKGNKKAWNEMKKYNIHDVLALEELYNKFAPWDNSINFGVYNEGLTTKCVCGGTEFKKRGFFFSPAGKFQRYKCLKSGCGKEMRDKVNLLSKEKRKTLKIGVSR